MKLAKNQPKRIFLIGPMGVGKTTIGKTLARVISSQRDTLSRARPEERFWVRRISLQFRRANCIGRLRGRFGWGAHHASVTSRRAPPLESTQIGGRGEEVEMWIEGLARLRSAP